jgi:cell division protease FtsH
MTNANIANLKKLRPLAALAIGRSGADIEKLVREARQKARRERRSMTWTDLEWALQADRIVMSDDLRRRVCVHEAGHALAWTLLGVGTVRSATIGIGDLGQVSVWRHNHLPQTTDWLMKGIACMLAGRAAELIIFGEAMAGAGGCEDSDLANATEYALAAETQLGFSSHQPLIFRRTQAGLDDLRFDRQLVERVDQRLEASNTMARELLEAQRPLLLELATRLNTVGVMEGCEVRGLLGVDEPSHAEVARMRQ